MKRIGILWLFLAAGVMWAGDPVDIAPQPSSARLPWWWGNMVDQPHIKPYEVLHPAPPEGAIPRGAVFEPKRTHEEGGAVLQNPLPSTSDVVEEGRRLWRRVCTPCHGDFKNPGTVPQKNPALTPPDLRVGIYTDPKLRPDGYLYEVIRQGGKALMPPYYDALTPRERWAVVRYIRFVQRGGQP